VPYSFMLLIPVYGHSTVRKRLARSAAAGHLPSSLLLHGPAASESNGSLYGWRNYSCAPAKSVLAGRPSGPTLALIDRVNTAYFGRPTSVGGCMTDINKRGLENETKGKIKETEGKFRGDVGKATGDTSEHLKGRAEEAKGKIQKDFGKTERKV